MRELADAVVTHFAEVKRDLPWRRTRDPYAIWVSEVMLQQTRVATVIPYWERWMARFPTVSALATAPLDDVLAAWAGLGYYSRARNLHAGAQYVVAERHGALPATARELREVKGIGAYTAGAIASIAYGERAPLVDGNVARVLARACGIDLDIKSTAGVKALWAAAGELMAALPAGRPPGDLNQGVMELGATVCTPTSPRCLICPIAKHCVAARDGLQDVLPVVAKRKAASELPLIEQEVVWCEAGGEILLARRDPSGLFGGLWELPPRTLLPDDVMAADVVALHDQVLTHRRLRVSVLRGRMPASLVGLAHAGYDRIARVALAEVKHLGIAAATSAILAKYEDIPWTSSSTPKPSPSSPRGTRRSSKASSASGSTRTTTTSRRPRNARRKASTS